MQNFDNFISGAFTPPTDGNYIDVYAPSKGEIYARVAKSGTKDVNKAVEAAQKAFPNWSKMPISERSQLLHKLANLILRDLDVLSQMETADTGKPIQAARTIDIPRASANFSFFASAIVNFSTDANIMEGEAINYTRRAPLGIVGCISPWNLPLYLFTWKIAPALAMGNCVIGKPSELTPATAWYLGKLVEEAGFPPGVLSILQGLGNEVGQAIVDHPEIKALSFTGGTHTGQQIASSVSWDFKKLSLELGGKNPFIVFADSDLDTAASMCVKATFSNQGQICLCGSRILVEDTCYELFKAKYLKKVAEIKTGDPTDPQTAFGALISAEHLEKVKGYIDLAKKEGGQIIAGGTPYKVIGLNGYFHAPTVIEGLNQECRVNQEEIFGPVVTLGSFKNEAEAVQLANSTKYGLAASVWTNNVKQAHGLAHQLAFGIVWVNCWMLRDLRTPFGGVKASGLGREGGIDALNFFSEPQNICIKI